MQEIQLSNNLKQIELEINWHKENAGKSIWEIGRRLNHVKENDLAHGEFTDWVENNVGIHIREAQRMMLVSNELPNTTNWSHLSSRAIYLISTLPEEEKEKQIERVENGEVPKIKEIEDLRRKLKESEERNKRLAEQALKQEVIEKEVVPEDYESTKQLNSTLLSKNKSLSYDLDTLERTLRIKENELKQLEENTSKSIALKDAIESLQADKNKLETSLAKLMELNSMATEFENFFDTKMAPMRFKTLIQGLGTEIQIDKIRDILTVVDAWLSEMNTIVPEQGRHVIEGEIING